jgi:hypothetical protein
MENGKQVVSWEQLRHQNLHSVQFVPNEIQHTPSPLTPAFSKSKHPIIDMPIASLHFRIAQRCIRRRSRRYAERSSGDKPVCIQLLRR